MQADEHSQRRRLLRLRPLKSRPERARRFRRGVYLLPSMFTMANMFCGYACIVHAMRGSFRRLRCSSALPSSSTCSMAASRG